MLTRFTRIQPRGVWTGTDIILSLLPFVPVVLLFAILDMLAPFVSSGQKTLEVAAYTIKHSHLVRSFLSF